MNKKTENGQAMIFIVIGFIVILGFVGLAIDGGMVFSDRRHAQNAADASSLAAGGKAALYLEDHQINYDNWRCSAGGPPVYNNESASALIAHAIDAGRLAAVARAATNDFTIDQDTSDFHGVSAQCWIYNYGSYIDKYIDFTVWITTNTQGNFTRFLFNAPLTSRVQSVTRIRPRSPLAFGQTVVALNPANCSGQQNGINAHGNGNITVHYGGFFSNGCLSSDGNPSITAIDGSIGYAGEVNGGGSFTPAAQQMGSTLPASSYQVEPPNCDHPDANQVTGSELKNASPLAPGLYCVTGNLNINGGDVIEGTDVTIYMVDGGISINGSATVNIHAPGTYTDPKPAIPGMLIFMAPGNDNEVQINGDADSQFTGTIYAPESNIDVTGNGTPTGYEAQFIGWNVEIGGTSDTVLWFCSCMTYSKPTSLDLNR